MSRVELTEWACVLMRGFNSSGNDTYTIRAMLIKAYLPENHTRFHMPGGSEIKDTIHLLVVSA